jgi:cephalosporin-C deacetylase
LTRREDFDAFWSGVLAAAAKQPLGAAFERQDHAARGVRVSRVTYDGFEGGRISGWYLEPEARGPHPALVVFHGYSGRAPTAAALLKWASQGLVVLATDCRGQVGSSTDGASYPGGHRPGFMTQGILSKDTYYYRYVYADGVRAVALLAAQPAVDAGRIGVTGVSQGGGLSLAAAALAADRVRFGAAAVPYLCHFRRAADIAEMPYREIADYVRAWPDRCDQVFETLSYFDNMNLAERVRGRMLVSVGLADLICPPSTVFAAYNHMRCPKELVVYPFHGHEEGDHWEERAFAFLVGGLRGEG